MKMILVIISVLFSFFSLQAQGQKETAPPNYIYTIEFNGSSRQNGSPIVKIGEKLRLQFDDIIGDEADYYYTIEHYNYDWSPTQLSKSEYMVGFDDVRILDYKNSYNTLQGYSHYQLEIPNSTTRGLKVSGNYMLKIFNAEKELVFSRKFMVYEPLATVSVNLRRSRDLSVISEKQVVNFSVESSDLILKNPNETVNVLILQNQNLRTAIKNIAPQYNIGNELIYRYDQETAFFGGNEYLQFDNKDLRASTVDINFIELNELYHHHLFPDRARANQPYTYQPDINGGFVVRSLQAREPETEAEYSWVHFRFENYSLLEGGEIHIYGNFNNFKTDQTTKLSLGEETDVYQGARLFKQGFYNYKYVLKRPDGSIDEGFFSGNFYQTENEYQVLIYYRSPGARYDRLIGVGRANSTNITN
ncbi:type IX secretion system plug protein [Salegentibacter sp. F14]